METPNWLTNEYVFDVLRKFYKDSSLNVTNIVITPALGKGENFGSILTKIEATLNRDKGKVIEKCQYLVKSSFEGDAFCQEKMAPYDPCNREMSIYEDVLPNIRTLLEEIGDGEKLFANVLHIDREKQAIFFEDLREKGFVMADRRNGLDMDHVKLILRKLAKMHAASTVFNERQNRCLEKYDRGFFNYYTNSYANLFVTNFVECGNVVSQWPEYAHLGKKIFAMAPYYMDIGRRCFTPTPENVNCFVHGDMWTNNVLFKYDKFKRQPIDVRIIDFQYSFWGSSTLDIHYLFQTSLQEEIRCNKLEILYEYYHKFFADTLRKLKYKSHPLPSLRVFRLEVEEKRFFALHSSCIVQPIFLNEDSTDADFRALMGIDERGMKYKRSLYANARVQENLKNLLPLFDRRGLLDTNQCH